MNHTTTLPRLPRQFHYIDPDGHVEPNLCEMYLLIGHLAVALLSDMPDDERACEAALWADNDDPHGRCHARAWDAAMYLCKRAPMVGQTVCVATAQREEDHHSWVEIGNPPISIEVADPDHYLVAPWEIFPEVVGTIGPIGKIPAAELLDVITDDERRAEFYPPGSCFPPAAG